MPRSTRKKPARRKRPRVAVRLSGPGRHPELWGLGFVALGAFLASVVYFGWNGGYVGGALADGFHALIGASTSVSRALIASADHAHTHDAAGPYGFDPAAAAYDARFRECCATGDFRPLAELVEPARADSLWQLLVLQGATGGRPLELLAYAAPTYYGMAVAIAAA